MANLKLSHIYKMYSNGTKAVNDFNMDIDDKEFIVFVGPSGCGKSTTLRMIAGLEEITAGELTIGDTVVNRVEPKERDIAMVFQNYALYPHMSVYENMAFGLRIRKLPKDKIDEKVKSAAEILGITDYLQKKPKEMSGGQRQRVALGRAIVREPKVFLLDEPLSNLDAKLRTSMRSEILKLHKKLQTTFIYVTHDQTEAMTMGTRIVVMKDGFVQQIDTPRNLYNYPVNKFVAGFIGTPQMNFFTGTLKLDKDTVNVKFDNTDISFNAPYAYFAKADKKYLDGEKKVIVGIRCEHVSSNVNAFDFKAKCRVSYSEDLGVDSQIYGDLNLTMEETVTDSATKIVLKAPAGTYLNQDDIIDISMDLSHLQIFDAETEKTIAPRIPEKTDIAVTIKAGVLDILGTKIKLPKIIAAEDGKYNLVIPTDAIKCGKTVKAQLVNEEDVNGQRLMQFDISGNPVFVKVSEEIKPDAIDIDLKLCTFEKDGEAVILPMPVENQLVVDLGYTKTVKENDERKFKFPKKYDYHYHFATAEYKIACPQDLTKLIISGGGKKMFSSKLALKFSPYAISVSENGIAATVEEVLDYGNEKFAKCKVDLNRQKREAAKQGETVEPEYAVLYVAVDSGFDASEVSLSLDVNRIAVYNLEHDIRLV